MEECPFLFSLEVYVDHIITNHHQQQPFSVAFALLDLQPILVDPPKAGKGAGSVVSYKRGKRCVFQYDEPSELHKQLASSALVLMLVTHLSEKQVRLDATCALPTSEFGPPAQIATAPPVAHQWGYLNLRAPLKNVEGDIVAHAIVTVSLVCLGRRIMPPCTFSARQDAEPRVHLKHDTSSTSKKDSSVQATDVFAIHKVPTSSSNAAVQTDSVAPSQKHSSPLQKDSSKESEAADSPKFNPPKTEKKAKSSCSSKQSPKMESKTKSVEWGGRGSSMQLSPPKVKTKLHQLPTSIARGLAPKKSVESLGRPLLYRAEPAPAERPPQMGHHGEAILGKIMGELCRLEQSSRDGSPTILGQMFVELAGMQTAIIKDGGGWGMRRSKARKGEKKGDKGVHFPQETRPSLSREDEQLMLTWFNRHRKSDGEIPASLLDCAEVCKGLPSHLHALLTSSIDAGKITWRGMMTCASRIAGHNSEGGREQPLPVLTEKSDAGGKAVAPAMQLPAPLEEHASISSVCSQKSSSGEFDQSMREMLRESSADIGNSGQWQQSGVLPRRRSWFEAGGTPKMAAVPPAVTETIEDFNLSGSDIMTKQPQASPPARQVEQLEVEEYESDFDS
jgi:hypothetical protein